MIQEKEMTQVNNEVVKVVENPLSFGRWERDFFDRKVSLLERRIIRSANEEERKLGEWLIKFKEELNKLNPKHYEKVPFWRKILGLIPKGEEILRRIVEQFETVEKNLNDILINLVDAKDSILKDNIELTLLEKELKEFMKELEKKIELGKEAVAFAKQKLNEVENPIDKKRLENSLFTLSTRLQDLETVRQAVLQFLISIEQIKQNNEMLLDSLDRAVTVTKPVLTIGIMIRLALNNQKSAINILRTTQEFTTELLQQNAEALKQQTREVEELYTNPVIALDKLEKAYTTLMEAINNLENVKKKGTEVAMRNIEKLHNLNEQLKKKFEEMEN